MLYRWPSESCMFCTQRAFSFFFFFYPWPCQETFVFTSAIPLSEVASWKYVFFKCSYTIQLLSVPGKWYKCIPVSSRPVVIPGRMTESGSPSSNSLYVDTAPCPCSLDKDHKSWLTYCRAVSGSATEIAGQGYTFERNIRKQVLCCPKSATAMWFGGIIGISKRRDMFTSVFFFFFFF